MHGAQSATLSVQPVSAARDPVAALAPLRVQDTHPRYAWLLESALREPRLGRYSFAGADPYLVLRARDRRITLDCLRAVRPGLAPGRTELEGDPLAVARALLPSVSADCDLPFVGGAVGYLGYELAAQLEPVSFAGRDDLGLPDLVLLFVDRVLAFEHETGQVFACGLGFEGEGSARRAADALVASLRERPPPAPPAGAPTSEKIDGDPAGYIKSVDAILEEIAAGNVYQACLTQRLERPFAGDPGELYRRLRASNPAPFAAFLELPEVAVVGSSPERFLRVAPDGRCESRPIKGTRPRGASPEEDDALRAALGSSPKDRAENVMIVDLVRNDLGRVCQTGSVHVPELMAIEAYASVFQMVSTVAGRLRPDRDAFDLVRATFPPGSMTGAPKIAAMRLLDRLEPVRRGVYSGAIGYFDARGGADLSVVIRTILVQGGWAYVHSGGGIVADSDPRAEWREALDKAEPALECL